MNYIEYVMPIPAIVEAIKDKAIEEYKEFYGFTMTALTPSHLIHYKAVNLDFEVKKHVSITVEGELTANEKEGEDEFLTLEIAEIHFFNDDNEIEYLVKDETIAEIIIKVAVIDL